MPYVMGDLGIKELTPEDIAAIQGPAAPPAGSWPGAGGAIVQMPVGTKPTTRPWPGAGGAIVQMPGGASGAGTAVTPTSTAGKPAGTVMGQNYVKPGTGITYATPGGKPTGMGPTGTIRPVTSIATGVAGATAGAGASAATPSGPAPTDTLPPSYEAPASGGAPGGSFFDQYKWWIIGGSVLLVATGIGAYFLLRRKGTATADIYDPKPCTCGSGEVREPVFDARGIFVTFTCPRCEAEKLRGFRKEIFTDPGYEADEPIEPEDY